jgi:hypothetical protein
MIVHASTYVVPVDDNLIGKVNAILTGALASYADDSTEHGIETAFRKHRLPLSRTRVQFVGSIGRHRL